MWKPPFVSTPPLYQPPFFAKSHFATWGMSIMPDGQQLSAMERFTTASNTQMLLTLNVQTTDGKIALFSPFLPWNCQTLHRRERIKQAPALSFFSFSIFFWSAHVKFLRRKYVVCGLTRPQFDWRVKYVTVAAAYPVSEVTMTHSVLRPLCLVLFFY